jgi:hypothetical protein
MDEEKGSTSVPILFAVRATCPRCRNDIALLPSSARFCPHCGVILPANCPSWPRLQPEPPVANVFQSGWLAGLWPLGFISRRRRIDPLFFARGTTVLAYINTMFNLGIRCEIGMHNSDPGEALRYYQKAAKLGHLPARARLQVAEDSQKDNQPTA